MVSYVAAWAVGLLVSAIVLRAFIQTGIGTNSRGIKSPGEPTPHTSGRCKTASVATQLAPLLSPHVNHQTQITIVGNRGDYSALVATKTNPKNLNDEKWISTLRTWLEAKAEIQYLLVAATDNGRAVLQPLAKEYKNFHLWEITPSDVENDVDKAYITELITFHPILLENSSQKLRAMWIENDHQPGSFVAKDCEFVAPRDARVDPRFDAFRNLLVHLIDCASGKGSPEPNLSPIIV